MGFPLMSGKKIKELCLPEFSGGINLHEPIYAVQNNQLTDGLNVWFNGAMVRTRPGMRINAGALNGDRISAYASTNDAEKSLKQSDIVPCRTGIYRSIDKKLYCLFAAKIAKPTGDVLLLQWTADDAIISLPEYSAAKDKIENFFVFEHKQELYCFVRRLKNGEDAAQNLIIKYSGSGWEEVLDDKFQVPLVLINGDMEHKAGAVSGKRYEGFNLLCQRYRMSFDADSCSDERICYRTMRKVKAAPGKEEVAIARFSDTDGNVVIHTVTITDSLPVTEAEGGSDGMRMRVWDEMVDFVNERGENIALPERYKGLRNNLELYLPFYDEEFEAKKERIFKMRCCVWYGGQSSGTGGARLFLGSNGEEKEKNLVVWSSPDNPLYFPENNHFYVGASGEAVTGFGKQNKALVLFKEREIYYTYCQQSTRGVSETVNGENIDYRDKVRFPLVQIHGFIGCDCPGSIQLCRNRLVWASSQGKVYTLANAGGNSERNVYEVSGMVERRLEKEPAEELTGALSCDWQGLYCLFVGNHVYLMDYNSYGYQYAYSYSKVDNVNAKIPWWYWELPEPGGVGSLKGVPHFVSALPKKLVVYRMEEDRTVTDGRVSFYRYYHLPYTIEMAAKRDLLPVYGGGAMRVQTAWREIYCMLQTGVFDFDLPQYKKAVPEVNIGFGVSDGSIGVTYITENGEYTDGSIVLRHNEIDFYSPGYLQWVLLRPTTPFSALFGIRFESKGGLAVAFAAIKYRVTGGAGR